MAAPIGRRVAFTAPDGVTALGEAPGASRGTGLPDTDGSSPFDSAVRAPLLPPAGAGERSGGSGASSGVSGAPGAGEVSSSGKAGPGPGSALDAMHWRVQKINKHGRLQERNMVVDLRAGTLSNYASDRLRKAFRLTSLWKLDTDLRDPRRLLIHFQPSARQGSYELVMTHADDRDELCKV